MTSSTRNIMIDIETLGTQPGSLIMSIGAHDGRDSFEAQISIVSALEFGLTVDHETQQWWRKQNRTAWERACAGTTPLPTALRELAQWVADVRAGRSDEPTGHHIRVWGDGATFDPVLLECAYRACGIPAPWTYTEVCCYRTLRNLLDSKKPAAKVGHTALSDATAQWLHLDEMLITMEKFK